MRTAEEVVIGDLDRTIGRIKAMRALAIEGEEIEACGVSQSLCEALRVILFEQVEVKNKLISKLIPRKINEVRGQLEYFEELLMTEEGRKVYRDIDNALMYIRDHYYEMKRGEKVCKRLIIAQVI